ncbi:alcohol dehydrogenase catalytic domain-containing protein [Alkalibaculum sp. M08DMB]|uniref:Alcohol dehydrogenase catalytic domain-containing protein n=1 Tax=Alkalibaculum sporogenes TaxID=2655001 RepID=A0A6A7K5J6_9FIRM|nr:alcohol dehydrogenase catalytic domain-containing protein [Alkalibaculum sporogenes]MPW24537.1 alcohol dehydrogenase catalytic domain-containing protein [Alkalibaculum sporogenes]
MKVVAAIKVGDMKDNDISKRGKVGIIDMPINALGDEDVKLKVAYCAICGSDPHLVGGIFGWEAPFGLGHEVSGVIVELGEKATKKGLKVGDRVAGNFLKFCGTCYYCQNGQQQFCEYANESNRPGMSEYIVWHESQIYKLPDDVSLKEGCLLEPISIAVRMMDKISPKFGGRVLISGGGPIGLLGLQAVKMYGATSLTISEPIAERRDLAIKYGADYAIDPITQDIEKESMKITNGRGYDTVVDCSGSVRAVGVLPKITARGGTLLYGAMYPNDYEMPFNLYKYCYMNELTVSGYYVAPYAFPRAIQMLTKMDLSDLTTKIYNIEDADEAFKAQLTGKYPKILIKCNKDLE